jgi:DNA-binding MarR family transcriptional regulator
MNKSWPDATNGWRDLGVEGANLQVNEFLTFHLLRLASLAKATVTKEYLEPAGLSVPEWRLLASVANFSPLPFADITSMTSMDKGQVSRTLRSAQGKGYVVTQLVPVDRRQSDTSSSSMSRVVVSVTPAGLEVYRKVLPTAQRYQASLLELMEPQERRVMLDVMQRMYRHLVAEARRT